MIDISSCLDIPGWMSEAELTWLAEQATHRHDIVEVGSWYGRSTRALALHTPGHVWAVDLWKDLDGVEPQNKYRGEEAEKAYAAFQLNLKDLHTAEKVSHLRLSSIKAASLFSSFCLVIDMIFLDGDHSYETVKSELLAYRNLLQSDGILCGHDIGFPGVHKAVNEVIKNYETPAGQIWVAKKEAVS